MAFRPLARIRAPGPVGRGPFDPLPRRGRIRRVRARPSQGALPNLGDAARGPCPLGTTASVGVLGGVRAARATSSPWRYRNGLCVVSEGGGPGRETAWPARGLVSARGHGLGGVARRPVCRSRARTADSGGGGVRPSGRLRGSEPPGRVGAARSIRTGPGGLPGRRGRGSYGRRGPGGSERRWRAPRMLAGRVRAAGCRGEIAYGVFAPARARGPSRSVVMPPGARFRFVATASVMVLGGVGAARVHERQAREATAAWPSGPFADPAPGRRGHESRCDRCDRGARRKDARCAVARGRGTRGPSGDSPGPTPLGFAKERP